MPTVPTWRAHGLDRENSVVTCFSWCSAIEEKGSFIESLPSMTNMTKFAERFVTLVFLDSEADMMVFDRMCTNGTYINLRSLDRDGQ